MDLKVGGFAGKKGDKVSGRDTRMQSTLGGLFVSVSACLLLCRKKENFESSGHDGTLRKGGIYLPHGDVRAGWTEAPELHPGWFQEPKSQWGFAGSKLAKIPPLHLKVGETCHQPQLPRASSHSSPAAASDAEMVAPFCQVPVGKMQQGPLSKLFFFVFWLFQAQVESSS